MIHFYYSFVFTMLLCLKYIGSVLLSLVMTMNIRMEKISGFQEAKPIKKANDSENM